MKSSTPVKIQVKDYSEEFLYKITPRGLLLMRHSLARTHHELIKRARMGMVQNNKSHAVTVSRNRIVL